MQLAYPAISHIRLVIQTCLNNCCKIHSLLDNIIDVGVFYLSHHVAPLTGCEKYKTF